MSVVSLPEVARRLATLVGRRYGAIQRLADSSGYNRTSVERYLKGERLPPLEFLACVADDHGVTLDWLAGREPQGHESADEAAAATPAPDPRLDLDPDILEALRLLQKLPRRSRLLLTALIREMLPPDE